MSGWHLIDIEKLFSEMTLSGNAGGGFPKPFLAVEDSDDDDKHKFPVLRPPNVDVDDSSADSEEQKLWKRYLR